MSSCASGPGPATWTGLTAALQATLRVVAFALCVAVFSLTTATDDLLTDLARRGTGTAGDVRHRRGDRTVPRMIARAGEIVDAQRARGLDTEGGADGAEFAGIVPLAGPMISGSLRRGRGANDGARGARLLGARPPDDDPADARTTRRARSPLVLGLGDGRPDRGDVTGRLGLP